MKKSFGEYFIGIDAGSDSLGWAVTDVNYNLLKLNGKALWGIRLFDEGQTAAERRAFRTSRRRIGRRVQRTKLLQELFSTEITSKDAAFYQRMEDSKFLAEDKAVPQTNTLFNDSDFTDKHYHKLYPTIYHLRKAFIDGDKIDDSKTPALPSSFSKRFESSVISYGSKTWGEFVTRVAGLRVV